MKMDKKAKIKMVKEHIEEFVTLKELEEKYGVGIFTRRKAFEEALCTPLKIIINLSYFEPILVGDKVL